VNIPPIIRELLLHHEKVVIPGFGTFSIVHRPAELSKTTGILLPPSKVILFDNREQTDDELLSGFIVRRYSLQKAEAMQSIAGFVNSVEKLLESKGGALLEGMGNLSRDKSGEVHFQPLEELLGKANLFGLPKLDIPVSRPASPVEFSPKPVQAPVTISRTKRRAWWIPAAFVALLAGLSALVYFTGLYERFQKRNAETVLAPQAGDPTDRLVFGNRTDTETDTLQEKVSKELDKRTAREKALMYKEPESTGKPTETPLPTRVQNSNALTYKPYHIIAGSFLVPNNAERQRSQLERKGFSPVVLPKQGDYYMVSLGSFDSREEAGAAMRQMRGKLEQELWVMGD